MEVKELWHSAAVQAIAPPGWTVAPGKDGSIRIQSPNGERWRYEEQTGSGTELEFIYSLLKAMLPTKELEEAMQQSDAEVTISETRIGCTKYDDSTPSSK